MKSFFCPKCGSELSETDPVCPDCSAVLVGEDRRKEMDRECSIACVECGFLFALGIVLCALGWWAPILVIPGVTLLILSFLPFLGNMHMHGHLHKDSE